MKDDSPAEKREPEGDFQYTDTQSSHQVTVLRYPDGRCTLTVSTSFNSTTVNLDGRAATMVALALHG